MQQSYSSEYADLWRRHWWWQVRHQIVLRELTAIAPPRPETANPRRLLDIGCAGGVAFDDWSKFGLIYGLEPDERLIDSTPHWRGRITQQGFGPDFQFDEPFDIALMLDVLEHIEDDRGALESLYQLLSPGGYAILTVPALMSLWSVHDEVNLHFRRYHKRPFRTLLTDAGFTIHKLEPLFCWSLPLVWLRKWLATREQAAYQVKVPGRVTNALFSMLTRGEHALRRGTGIPLPWGSSLLAVIQRPATTNSPIRVAQVARQPV